MAARTRPKIRIPDHVSLKAGRGRSNHDQGDLFKLGTCGIEQIGQLPASYWTPNQFCGKIKGGAAFCTQNYCVTYSDETGETTLLPYVRF